VTWDPVKLVNYAFVDFVYLIVPIFTVVFCTFSFLYVTLCYCTSTHVQCDIKDYKEYD